MKPLHVDCSTLRRYLIYKQGLTKLPYSTTMEPPISSVDQKIKTLECVQLDPVSVVERNQHLVLATRLPGYKPEMLNTLLFQNSVFEYWANAACVIPMKDYPLFKVIRNQRKNHVKNDLEKMKEVTRGILSRLENEGPLPSRAFKSTTKVHGYWDNISPKTKETSHALSLLLDSGVIRVVGREGNDRFFGITNQTIPKNILDEAQDIDTKTSQNALIDKYIKAYHIVDPRDSRFGWINLKAKDRYLAIENRVNNNKLIPLEVEGIKRTYYMRSEERDLLQDIAQRPTHSEESECFVTFLPPLDNLLWSRDRIKSLFQFDYKWEIYIPQAKRRYGPYAMPILYGDNFIGRLDPLLDRKNNKLIIRLLQFEPKITITATLKEKVLHTLDAFAKFHQVDHVDIQKIAPHQALSL